MQTQKVIIILLLLTLEFTAFTQNLFDGEESVLTEQWDLNDTQSENNGLFVLKKYKPLYVLLGKLSTDVNKQPQSDNPKQISTDPIPLNKTEVKFQLSMKTKILNNAFGKKAKGDFWVGYTQSSFWQVYNFDLSRPFRETNYEPELMFILPVKYSFLGLESAFMGIGINHQSNGRSNPYSRSWNRIIAQFAWEGKNTLVIFKPWLRLSEDLEEDDNPGIEDYMGRAELLVAYGEGRHDVSCRTRHSMRFGNNNHGSIQISYAIRIRDHLKFHTQFFSGYGESMIDFNHRQTTIGFGLSLVEWR